MEHLFNVDLCEIINPIHINIFYFGHAKFGNEWSGARLNPEFSRLYYIIDGSTQIIANGEKTILTKGNWYLLPAGCSFEYSCPEYAEHVYFHLSLQNDYELDMLNRFERVTVIPCPAEDTKLLSGNVDSSDAITGMKIFKKAYSIIISMLEENNIDLQPKKLSPCVKTAIEYMRLNLSATLTMDEISAHTCVSRSTLTKKFQAELSVSVMNYLFDMLMSQAKHLLSRSDLSIAQVSEKLGFSDQFYFSKRFKAKFGTSPSSYRKMPIT